VLLSAAPPLTHAKRAKPPAGRRSRSRASRQRRRQRRGDRTGEGDHALSRQVDADAPALPAARVAVGDAKIADVILLNPSEIYMLGKTTGATNLIVWNRANQASVIDITVGLDTAALRAQFSELFPNERDIRITVSGNSLILHGTVADAVKASQSSPSPAPTCSATRAAA
jgi:pilus assembly protein CpaC